MSVEEITAIQHDSKEKIEAAKTLNKEIQDLEADPGWLDIKGLENLEKLITQAKAQIFGGNHLDGVGVMVNHLEESKKPSGEVGGLDGLLEEGLEQVGAGLFILDDEEQKLELVEDGPPLQVEFDAAETHQVGFRMMDNTLG
jgi:hypothetical protein